jgi:DNA topoisomerase-1
MKISNDELSKANSVLERGKRSKWIRRTGSRKRGFGYLNADGIRIIEKSELERIKCLVIPPAWTDVRICPSSRGKLQAIGIDEAGRVQYRYSEKFSNLRQGIKFARITEFGRALPALRRQLNADIALEGYPKAKVLAVMIRLINDLYIRVGSEQSVKLYKTYGVTTLRNRHLQIKENGELCFNFVGKHHIRHRRIIVDEELATILRDLKTMGGSKLFNYQDDTNKVCPIKPHDINNYIKTATGGKFSAKDFRTWGASVLAAGELAELGVAENATRLKKNIVHTVKIVAEHLGNTPAVCRSSYIHPAIITYYEKGITIEGFVPRTKRQVHRIEPEYLLEEVGLLKLLTDQNCK